MTNLANNRRGNFERREKDERGNGGTESLTDSIKAKLEHLVSLGYKFQNHFMHVTLFKEPIFWNYQNILSCKKCCLITVAQGLCHAAEFLIS